MRVIVTGGSGFIGSHIVDQLSEQGFDTRVFDLEPSRYRDDIEFLQGSVLSPESLRAAIEGVDAVFHISAVADVKDVFESPVQSEEINVRGTLNVLEAARSRRRPPRVVYASTTWVYSNLGGAVLDEESPLSSPDHLYTATKLSGEHYCHAYSQLYGVPVTILRYGIPYGPRARDGAVIPILVKKALRGEPLTIAGDGSQFRQFIYVEDLARGNVAALQDVAENRVYNLDGLEAITIKRLAETIRELLGDVSIQYVEGRPGDFAGKHISSERAKVELGWEPRTGIVDGIRRYIEWLRSTESDGGADQ